jgi:hypothetical protein
VIYALEPIAAALTADSLTATLVAGSTTSVLQLGDGEAEAWAGVEYVSLSIAAASNKDRRPVRRIIEVDEDLDTVTLDRALVTEPSAGDTLEGGFVEWVRPISVFPLDKRLYYVQQTGVSKLEQLLLADTSNEARCVVLYGETHAGRTAFTANEERYRFRILSRVNDFAVGCTSRLMSVLDARRASLTVPGRKVYSVDFSDAIPQFRNDPGGVLFEKHVTGIIVTTKAAAA